MLKSLAVYNKLTIIEYKGKDSYNRKSYLCLCDCGKSTVVDEYSIVSGNTKSCGCLRYTTQHKTHGMSRTSTYKSWAAAKSRCNNIWDEAYDNYGGRGITVCEEWQSFKAFLLDMGVRPKDSHLHRINNNLGYSKDNCIWINSTKHRKLKHTR